MMLKNLIDENHIDFDESNLKKTCELIRGSYSESKTSFRKEKAWLFDIVSNKRNAIDVDKFDYI